MEKRKSNIKNKKAFTLIELLIVIAIIGILASLIIANLSTARARARDAQRKAHFSQLQSALEMYFDKNGQYPAAINNGTFTKNQEYSLCSTGFVSGSSCPAGSVTYAKFKVPIVYDYTYTPSNNAIPPTYSLSVQLETEGRAYTCTPSGCN